MKITVPMLAETYKFCLVLAISGGLNVFANMFGFFRSIPVELKESACMDVASIYRTFYTIILPII
ncbi:hypothetical protein ICC18_05625 [Paenibacillus sp. WST5]|uniref:Uncharacterized protein n=2 Tax=Paenibacillus sedimenti TaxID=2770274 RepID=A0A926QIG4_9BACL|nr:hypothetical protein [Paenibacillus sedimenti]